MISFMKTINDIIMKSDEGINENIIGINYLEKLKYLIINNLKEDVDKATIDDIVINLEKNNNQSINFNFKNRSLVLSVDFYKDSLSKIKSSYGINTLSIVIKGNKVISLFDLNDKKKVISISISKNMGLVLSENTVTSENIASGSIILNLINKRKEIDIEN